MTTRTMRRWRRLIVLALLLPFASACGITPEPVHLGSEECAHCSMLITERRYAAQLLNANGKAFKFDAIECLRDFVQGGSIAQSDIHSLWVTDAGNGEDWVSVDEAVFLHSAELRTPMGGGLAAYATSADAEAAAATLNGHLMTWAQLLAMAPAAGSHHGGSGTGHDAGRRHGADDNDQGAAGDGGHDHGP